MQRLHGSKPVDVATLETSFMLIFIHQTYSPTLTEQEICDCTRQFWYQVSEANRTPDEEGALRYPVIWLWSTALLRGLMR